MADFVLLPQKGLTEESAIITSWYVKEGDAVKKGDVLFDIETGKAIFTVESETDGTVLKRLAEEGDELPIKSVVCVIGAEGEAYSLPGAPPADDEPPKETSLHKIDVPPAENVPPDVTFVRMPQKGLTEESAVLAAWHVKEGDAVKKGDELFDIETGKATFTVESEADGTVLETAGNAGDEIPIQTVVCVIGPPGASYTMPARAEEATRSPAEAEEKTPAPTEPQGKTEGISPRRISISPRAKALAAQYGIDIGTLKPTGADGRISVEDVEQAAKTCGPAASGFSTVKNTPVRRAIARNMAASLQSMAQFTLHTDFDASAVLAVLDAHKKSGADISMSGLIVYAVSQTILAHPAMNAHFSEEETKIYSAVNVGVAVDTPGGLLVPVITGAEKKNLRQISDELRFLADRCRNGTIGPDEMNGGTFTISNLGSAGITHFTPIIVPPQTAILGVGRVDERLRKSDGTIEAYPSMGLSLTIDHRAVDGAPAARWLGALCKFLEVMTVGETE